MMLLPSLIHAALTPPWARGARAEAETSSPGRLIAQVVVVVLCYVAMALAVVAMGYLLG